MRPTRRSRLKTAERRIKRKRVDPRLAEHLRAAQNPSAANTAGAITAVAAAMAWMILVLSSQWLLPFISFWLLPIMPIAIGSACGLMVGYFGRGIEPRFGFVAMVFTGVGWLLGLGLIAYALKASPLLLLSANPLWQHIPCFAIGLTVAYGSSFFWLTKPQKVALRNERDGVTKRK